MFQLVYASAAWVPFTQTVIEDILLVSRTKNLEHGVTGVLLYKSGLIVQVLEGEEAGVRRLYANIERDRRHYDVTTIYTRPIEAREFPGWTMGFNCVEVQVNNPPYGFSPIFQRADVLAEANGRGARMLKAFAATTR